MAIRFEKGTGQIDNNVTTGSGQYAIYLSAAVKLQDATIRGNRLETSASHSALRLESPDPVLIEGNTIAGALTYGIYLHLRVTFGWRGRRLAWYAVIALFAMIVSYWGIPFTVETFHSGFRIDHN